jgi:tripeptide aminopeptidase
MSEVLDRFLRYVRIDSASVAGGHGLPSSPGQAALAGLIEAELGSLGGPWSLSRLGDGSLLVRLPPTPGCEASLHAAFLSHLDTYFGLPGGSRPRLVAVDGRDIEVAPGVVIKAPQLEGLTGRRVVVSDGHAVLGADDKAGVAALVTVLARLAGGGQPHGPMDVWFTVDEETGHDGASYLPAGLGRSWDVAWTVDGEALRDLSVGDLAIRRVKAAFRGVDAHPCLHGKDLVPAHYAAARFVDRLADLPNPMTSGPRAPFYQVASLTGSSGSAEVLCRLMSFDRSDLEPMVRVLKGLAEAAAGAYGAKVDIATSEGGANFHEALVARPELIEPARRLIAEAGQELREVEIRGGTDGGMLALSFPGLPAPDLGNGARNPHSLGEFLVVDELEALPGILEGIIADYATSPSRRPLPGNPNP